MDQQPHHEAIQNIPLSSDIFLLRQKQTYLSQPLLAALDIYLQNDLNPFSINIGSGNTSDQLVKIRLVAYTLKKLMLIPIKQMDNNMWHIFKHSVQYILSIQTKMNEPCVDMMMDILKEYYKSVGKQAWPRVRVGFSLLEKSAPPTYKDEIYLFRGTLESKKQFLNWISSQNYSNQKLKDFVEKCKKIEISEEIVNEEDKSRDDIKIVQQINPKDILQKLIYQENIENWKMAMQLQIEKLNQQEIEDFCQFLENYSQIGLNQFIKNTFKKKAQQTLIEQLKLRASVYEKFMKKKPVQIEKIIQLLHEKLQ